METNPEFKLDKTAFSVVSLAEADDEKDYWLSKTPQERLQAVELIRQMLYGYDPSVARMQKVFTVVHRSDLTELEHLP